MAPWIFHSFISLILIPLFDLSITVYVFNSVIIMIHTDSFTILKQQILRRSRVQSNPRRKTHDKGHNTLSTGKFNSKQLTLSTQFAYFYDISSEFDFSCIFYPNMGSQKEIHSFFCVTDFVKDLYFSQKDIAQLKTKERNLVNRTSLPILSQVEL